MEVIRGMRINLWPSAKYRSPAELELVYTSYFTNKTTTLDHSITERRANAELIGSDAYFEDKQLPHSLAKDSVYYDSLLNTVSMSLLVARRLFYYHNGIRALLRQLVCCKHHEQEHGFVTRRSTLEFSSRAEFQAWKEKTEREEQVQFIATRGATRLSSGATKRYLECHRSGVSVQSGQDGDKVNVEYQAEHYGHEKSVAHLRLSATEVDAIAQKLSIGVPIRRILADAHSSELDRLRTLTTKDIYNIKYKYRIGSEQRDPEETQALLDSIQADVIPEPQISGLENIRTLLGAALQDLANKESGDPALLELAVKKAYEIRLLVKQFPDKQPSVAKPIAANKTLEKQPGY
ncbi:hypothetical protein V5799_025431 [Amblyomma americanum]|uniref:Uncharacterized protein n=1 Tax=Amblyomma americanum TaxID=6943 RepID=A0AAQ4E9H7_AMBAM